MSLKDNLSSQLKLYRKLRNETIVEFSSSLGIAKSTLQEFEVGKGNPTLDTIDTMEKNLHIDEGSLLSGKEHVPASFGDMKRLLSAVPALSALPAEKRPEALRLLSRLAALYDNVEEEGPKE